MTPYPGLRRLVLAALAPVVVSGLAWLALDSALDPQDYADPLRGWRHRALVVHGVFAYGLLWALGLLFALHRRRAGGTWFRRTSGALLGAAFLVLIVTALVLYYPPGDGWRAIAGRLHQALGLGLPLLAAAHLGRRTACASSEVAQEALFRPRLVGGRGIVIHAWRRPRGRRGACRG